MTREAAIKILMDGELNPCVAEDREACDMAIKALEQEPTTKNDLGVDCISREQAKEAIRDKFKDLSSRVEINTILNDLPSVTPQLSSELDKNSKKLEKNFGESDCISREQALRELKESAEHHANDSREEVLLRRDRDIIRALPSVTPQEPILDQISEIIEPLRHLPIGEMSDIEWDILRVIDKYKGESEG